MTDDDQFYNFWRWWQINDIDEKIANHERSEKTNYNVYDRWHMLYVWFMMTDDSHFSQHGKNGVNQMLLLCLDFV